MKILLPFVFSVLFFSGCSNNVMVDALVRAEFIYVNDSSYQVDAGLFTLQPKGVHIIVEEGMGPLNVEPNDLVPPRGLSEILKFNGAKCANLYKGDNAWGNNTDAYFNILNYEVEKVKVAYSSFKFTYTFVNGDYDKAEDCEQ